MLNRSDFALFLLRHSFAEPFGAGDRERRLTPDGIAAARECGARLKRLGFSPGLAVCSPARRARQTAEIVAAELGLAPATVVVEERLYACSGEEIPGILEPYFAQSRDLLAVGHNPAVSEWVRCCGAEVSLRPCEGRFLRRKNGAWSEA